MGTPLAMALVGEQAAPWLLRTPRPDEILDLVMKRNLVFLSWKRGDKTGTWIWSFDREGRLISWTEA